MMCMKNKEGKKQAIKQTKTYLSIKLNKTESSLYQKGCLGKTFKQTNKQLFLSVLRKIHF